MTGKDDEPSPAERERTANRRWMIGLVLSLVFGIFGGVIALLNYLDRDRPPATIDRRSPPADPAPAPSDDKGKGHDKK